MRILCAAVLLVCMGCSSSDQRRVGSPAAVQPEVVDVSKPPQELVEEARLMATLRELPTKRAALGDEESREGLRKTEAMIQRKLVTMGYQPRMQEFKWALPAKHWPVPGSEAGTDAEADAAKLAEHTWHNIIVEIPGKDLPGEIVLIGAHFDAVPMGPGADDNGSGTAGLLEMARVLKGRPARRTIRLVFFNLEECGLVGSTKYVSLTRGDWKADEGKDGELTKPKEKIVGMVSLEMLGYFSDEPNSQKSPIPPVPGVFEPPTVGDSIAVVGIKRDQAFIGSLAVGMRASAPELKLTVVDFLPLPVPDMTRSDHRPFMIAGVPAVMVTDTANFRNPNYHQPTDTVDTIDPRRYTLVVKAMAGAAYSLAEPIAKP
jgi:hypothetical protein